MNVRHHSSFLSKIFDLKSESLYLFRLILRSMYKNGPEIPYSKKNTKSTLGGSNDMNEIINEIINRVKIGTFCLKLKSLKLAYAKLLTMSNDKARVIVIV